MEVLDDGQLDTQLKLEKYEQDHQQQEDEGRTTSITISDEEQPTDTEEPRQARLEDEPPVPTNKEMIVVSKEQLPREAGITKDVAATQPVDTGESDTGNGQEPGMEEEERETEGSREEPVQQEQTRVDEPEQQPPRPEADREAGTKSKQVRRHLMLLSKVCWTYWTKNEAMLWVRSVKQFPTGVPCVSRSRA